MLVSTTVLLTILSAVSLGVVSGYLAVWAILRLLARRPAAEPKTATIVASAAHASGD